MSAGITLEHIIDFLLGTPMFDALDPEQLADLVRGMQLQRTHAGQAVFREGDEGDGWYVVYEGRFEVTRALPGRPARVLATLGPRDCVGEMAVLDGKPRSATLRSLDAGTLFRFPREAFERMVAEGRPGAARVALALARVTSERHRRINELLLGCLAEGEPADGRAEPLAAAPVGE